MANDEQKGVGRDQEYCFFWSFLMSFEAVRQQSLAFSTLVSTKAMPNLWSFRTPMTSSTCDVEAAIPRIGRETASEVSSTPA